MTKLVNLAGLQKANETYQPALRQLPAFLLEPFLKTFNMNLITVNNKDIIKHLRRRGALMKPYGNLGGETAAQKEVFKIVESVLTVDKAFVALKDYIGNYTEKEVLVAAGNKVNNQTKNHPLERIILENVVKTFVEDYVVCSFHAERDDNGTSPADSFDGFYTKLATLIAASEVSTTKGNLIETGAFAAPGESSDPLKQLLDFFRALNPFLKSIPMDFVCPSNVITHARDGLVAKYANLKVVTTDDLFQYIKDNADLSYKPNLCTHAVLGTGQRIMALQPGLLSVGMNTKTDVDFVQVRAPYEDPNMIQFWIQAEFGSRIDDWDPKVFATNERASVANLSLMGDYIPVSS
jgi:hypothetical protein